MKLHQIYNLSNISTVREYRNLVTHMKVGVEKHIQNQLYLLLDGVFWVLWRFYVLRN
jgi:hypothetical protein